MGRQPLLPNAENCSCQDLMIAAKAAPNQAGYNRLTAMRKLIEGWSPSDVASFLDVSRQTLRNWIKSFNARGIDGLLDEPRSGAPRKISPAQSMLYEKLIRNPDLVDETHWTAVKFHGFIRHEFQHEVGYRTVTRWLHDRGFRLKVPSPWPDRQDERARELFLQQLSEKLSDETIDIWYQDETGIEGDPRPRRRWVKKGEKSRIPYGGKHIRINVAGMICPRTGCFYALEFNLVDSQVFQVFLDHANADLTFERKTNILILDNASWHKTKSLRWGKFTPLYLPPYSPDLNPIEKLWMIVKAEWFADYYAKTYEELITRVDMALLWLICRTQENQETCKKYLDR